MILRRLCYSRSMIFDVLRAIVTRSPPHPLSTRAALQFTSPSRNFIHIKAKPNAAVALEEFDHSLGQISAPRNKVNNSIPTTVPNYHTTTCNTITNNAAVAEQSCVSASSTGRTKPQLPFNPWKMKKGKAKPGTVNEYNRRIYFAVAQQQVNKSIKLFKAMERQGLIPDVTSYTMIINAFCNACDMVRAEKWYHRMRANGIEPDVYTYTSLIDGYMRMADLARSEAMFRNMMIKGIRPTRTTYNVLMHHSMMQLDIETAVGFWGKLVNAGLRPDIYTYAIMIHGLGDEGQIDKAWRLYETMIEQNVDVNEVVATALMGMHVRSHDNTYAANLFRTFFGDGTLIPSAHTRNTLLNALIAGADLATIHDYYSKYLAYLEQRDSVCKQPCQFNRPHDRSKKGDQDELFVGANVFTYTTFMRAFLRRDALPMVSQVYQDMIARGVKPTLMTYGILMLAHAYIPDPHSCRKILNEIKTAGLKPNAVLYTILMRAWAKTGRWDEMKRIYQEMKTERIQPTKLTMSVLQWGRKQAR
ncbi:hypothetical protein BX666DRAFT_2003732 [Dichotomocladium elegans]|nr:hypothetical protein BX666DRAFT_2003732 [Dichotomocladium elegans]